MASRRQTWWAAVAAILVVAAMGVHQLEHRAVGDPRTGVAGGYPLAPAGSARPRLTARRAISLSLVGRHGWLLQPTAPPTAYLARWGKGRRLVWVVRMHGVTVTRPSGQTTHVPQWVVFVDAINGQIDGLGPFPRR